MGYTFLIILFVILIISYIEGKGKVDKKGIRLATGLFKTGPVFNIGAIVICTILVVLYTVFW